ncbi:hypothetical protein Goari_004877 [Gossypium aridum]|uniref:Uncharacterized protein n=1 Tax=Gossypium aridum TaxID=34290 RepID=A0A7J8Y4V2_GOSAI|nr:hypothetical protein [Gossypium aridum]
MKERQYDAPVYWMEEVPKEVERFINCDRGRFEASKKAWWILSPDVDWWLIFDELSRYRGVGKLRKDNSDERWIPAAPAISLMQERDMENTATFGFAHLPQFHVITNPRDMQETFGYPTCPRVWEQLESALPILEINSIGPSQDTRLTFDGLSP